VLPVRPESKSGVAQAAQITHSLAIGSPLKLWLVEDCFFELRVCDLAVCGGVRGVERRYERIAAIKI